MKLVIFGLSITSSWGNGHATTYRGLVRALANRGHEITFFEARQPWYADHADLPEPAFCRLVMYADLPILEEEFSEEVAGADAVIVGSYVPDGVALGKWVTAIAGGWTAFYDIDTPVTLAALERGQCGYLSRELIPDYDFILSFTGGPTLGLLQQEYGARRAEAFYCSVDEDHYYPDFAIKRWMLGYLGTYSPDRQRSLEERLFQPARHIPQSSFVVGGAQYPASVKWPANVEQIDHIPPGDHRQFYNAQLFTLNITRDEMLRLGWSPSVRLFEAAACGTPIITDDWEGLSDFFEPGVEILVAQDAPAVRRILLDVPETERWEISRRARARVLREHTATHRARQLENLILENSPGLAGAREAIV